MTSKGKKYSDEELDAHVLYMLARKRIWGGKHTPLKYARSDLPPEHRGEAEDIGKRLAKKDLVTWQPKTGSIHISLNPRKRKEIMEIIEKYYGKQLW